MRPRDDEDPAELLTRVQRLNAVAQGIAAGLVLGLATAAATLFLVAKGGPVVGPHLVLLSQFYPGYRVTVVGALIGFAYSFVVGFGAGWAISSIYNRLVRRPLE
jgi:hypothetical protein